MLDSAAALRLHRLMREGPNLTAGKRADRAGCDARLAAALRDNLRRRKGQARAQAASREAGRRGGRLERHGTLR